MTIPLKKEPKDFQELLAEVCYFCHRPTRFWHIRTNNPVCQLCASVHKVCELPNHLRNKK